MKKTRTFKSALCIVLAVCLVLALSVSGLAANTANAAVTNDTNGVLQVNVVYTDDNGTNWLVQRGSGFLINDTTLVTCNHVVAVNQSTIDEAAISFGKPASEVRQRLSIMISVLRDVTVKATIHTESAELDYAILDLSSPIYNRQTLPIRSSSEVQATENCYALGFPGEVKYYQDVNSYDSEDVTITSGKVNKLNTIAGVNYVQSSATMTDGNSGGPLVDEDGNVIGICAFRTGDGYDNNYFYAIASDQLISVLDALGVEWVSNVSTPTTSPDPSPSNEVTIDKSALVAAISDAENLNPDGYTAESYAAVSDALSKANAVNSNSSATQSEIDAAASALRNAANNLVEKKAGFPIWAIALIAVVIVAAVVVAIVLSSKKKAPAKVASAANPVSPMGGVTPPVGAFTPPTAGSTSYGTANGPGTTVLNQGSGETTVLNQGSNETTVLSQNQNFGTLLRKKNGESIRITKANFKIGKERNNVDYCINDNTAISRVHVVLVSRSGSTYAADQRSTNGTFVNNVRVDAGKEVRLKNGDKLTLGDEDFVYNG